MQLPGNCLVHVGLALFAGGCIGGGLTAAWARWKMEKLIARWQGARHAEASRRASAQRSCAIRQGGPMTDTERRILEWAIQLASDGMMDVNIRYALPGRWAELIALYRQYEIESAQRVSGRNT